MKRAPVRHRAEYALYWLFKTVLQRLPASISRGIGRGLGRLAHLVLGHDRRLARANLAKVLPEWSGERCRETIARAYRNYGDTLALSFLAGRDEARWVRQNVSLEGAEHLRAARGAGRGILLITAHLGYWELCSLRIGLELGHLNVVYRPLDNPHIDSDVTSLRDRFGIRLIPKSGAASPLLRALKRGEAIGLLPDQRVPAHQGIVVPFLGHPAMTTSLPAALAQRTGCAVLPTFCLPDGEGGCRVTVGAPLELGLESPRASRKPTGEELAELTARIMAPLEEAILAHPEFWLWAHRRWKLDR